VDQLDLSRQDTLTLVSSLPLRDRTRLEMSIVRVSAGCPRFRLIQYSYFKREPFPSPAANLRSRQKQTVIRNIPPATL
jgi:phospholipid N-methyltransferase